MVTSYFSVKHLTVSFVRATTAHTGPFHTLLNHPSGRLLTVTNLPVYRQEPVPQLHSIKIQKTCVLTTAVSISDLANTNLTRMQMSVCP